MLPGTVAVYSKGPPAMLQTHRVRMNFRPGSLPRLLVCHSRSSGFGRLLTDDRVAHDRVAEMVDDRGDGERATESVVETCLSHGGSYVCCPSVAPFGRTYSNEDAVIVTMRIACQVFCWRRFLIGGE